VLRPLNNYAAAIAFAASKVVRVLPGASAVFPRVKQLLISGAKSTKILWTMHPQYRNAKDE
jgi:hypothetical protein